MKKWVPYLLTLLAACGESPTQETTTDTETTVLVDTSPEATYVFEVWETTAANVGDALTMAAADDAEVPSRWLLRARNDGRVVQVSTWKTLSEAEAYASSRAQQSDYKVLTAQVASHGAAEGARPVVKKGSSVQYSEFLMKRKSALDTLAGIAQGMTGGMVQTEPTLDFIMTLNSVDSSTISLFGLWNTEEGFEIFAERNTFGEEPYWGPYAENAHHMFEVVATK